MVAFHRCRGRQELKKIVVGIATVLLLSLIAVACIVVDLFFYAKHPAGTDGKKKVVVVALGQGVRSISNTLETQGIIRHKEKFRRFSRIKGYDKDIKAGEYVLSADMSPADIFRTLVGGKVQQYRLTVPEGYTIGQIAAAVEASELGTQAAFFNALSDADLLDRLGVQAPTFEGYLFPDTYYFPRGVSPGKIISTMVNRFWRVYTPAWKDQTAQLGFSVHQVVTLASIIEKETGAPIERPLISSVFHNRFKKKMRLESDPTVIYGIKDFNGNLTRKDLTTPTPYNTYTRRGLPPGPIANPGRDSIKAVLSPADTDFLYFVAKGDGTHQFSSNIRDHNRAVRKYQLRR